MTGPMGEECSLCYYYEDRTCLRSPPSPHDGRFCWPPVAPKQWCGVFKPRDSAAWTRAHLVDCKPYTKG